MIKTVYKYKLSFGGPTIVELTGPVVHVGMQGDTLCLWAEAEVHPPRTRTFSVYGTGHDIASAMQHVGSAIDPALGLVWHVYEPKS